MSKSRIICAGNAGSMAYNTNVSMDIAGGTKKQGYPGDMNRVLFNTTHTRHID
jgi:hypothetical protein